jgi:hypothetical protein
MFFGFIKQSLEVLKNLSQFILLVTGPDVTNFKLSPLYCGLYNDVFVGITIYVPYLFFVLSLSLSLSLHVYIHSSIIY